MFVESRNFTSHFLLPPSLAMPQREHNIGYLSLGPQLLHYQQIPPGKQSYYFTGRCSLDVDEKLAPDGLTVTDYFPHMHYRGRRLWTEIIGEGTGAKAATVPSKFAEAGQKPLGTLGRVDNFDSMLNLPYKFYGAERSRKLKKGDLLATTCIYNTEGLENATSGGFGTYEEMCINFVVSKDNEPLSFIFYFVDST
jgi:hypothetical protein